MSLLYQDHFLCATEQEEIQGIMNIILNWRSRWMSYWVNLWPSWKSSKDKKHKSGHHEQIIARCSSDFLLYTGGSGKWGERDYGIPPVFLCLHLGLRLPGIKSFHFLVMIAFFIVPCIELTIQANTCWMNERVYDKISALPRKAFNQWGH